jgi:multiple sugar transport system ATP-binding protein
MASVTLRGVKKVYRQGGKDVTAVHGVDLEVKDGELVVLVGLSGCGKSTTLRMVAGLELISSGELHFDGRLVNNVPANDRDVTMVFQSCALYPHMTAYDNMALALKLRGMSKAEIDARVKEAAGILGIGELLGRRPKDMSGGQRQRVAVGRAIVRHPRVFLFDEPLSNLDAKLRVQTRREIAWLHQQLSATMLYVRHDQVEAMTLGDRIVVLEGGHVKQIDTPMNLYERPKNTFVAAFIGSPSMNLLPGAIVAGPGIAEVGFVRRTIRSRLRRAVSGVSDWQVWRSLGDHGRATRGLRDRSGRKPAARRRNFARAARCRGAAGERGASLGAYGREGDHGARATAWITGGGEGSGVSV